MNRRYNPPPRFIRAQRVTLMVSSTKEVTDLLLDWSNGSQAALERLTPLVYGELHRLAHQHMKRERRYQQAHTLQTSALVNEAYLRLIDQRDVRWQNRAQFFAIASRLMRRVLVDYARTQHRAKRGGRDDNLPLEEAIQVADDGNGVDLLALDEALTRLAEMDEQQSRIVELRYFSGLTIEETAKVLHISTASVKRDWNMAKAW